MGRDQQPDWDGTAYGSAADHHRAFDDWFLDRLSPEATDVVVDLGSGSGEFTARLAEIAVGGQVIGIEPDPSMLEAARRHEAPNLSFVGASAEHLPQVVDDASVDLVVSRAMLHWLALESYPRVFSGALRALRPGGWFHSESAGAGNVPRVVEMLEELSERFDAPSAPAFPDAGVVLEMLEAAGFEMPADGVRTVAQRRPFSRDRLLTFLRTQATVALTRSVSGEIADEIVGAAVDGADRLRRQDGTYDQTFVRLEILARRPG